MKRTKPFCQKLRKERNYGVLSLCWFVMCDLQKPAIPYNLKIQQNSPCKRGKNYTVFYRAVSKLMKNFTIWLNFSEFQMIQVKIFIDFH